MKQFLPLLFLTAGLLVTGCETHDDHHRYGRHGRVVYTDRVADDRVVYRDDVVYRRHLDTNRDYPRRSLDRTYGF